MATATVKINKKWLIFSLVLIAIAISASVYDIKVIIDALSLWYILLPMAICGGIGAGFDIHSYNTLKSKITTVSMATISAAISAEEANDKESYRELWVGISFSALTIILFVLFLALFFEHWRDIVTAFVLTSAVVGLVVAAVKMLKKTVVQSAKAVVVPSSVLPSITTPPPVPPTDTVNPVV